MKKLLSADAAKKKSLAAKKKISADVSNVLKETLTDILATVDAVTDTGEMFIPYEIQNNIVLTNVNHLIKMLEDLNYTASFGEGKSFSNGKFIYVGWNAIKCQACLSSGRADHVCPFKIEISKRDTKCNCCKKCTFECAMDI